MKLMNAEDDLLGAHMKEERAAKAKANAASLRYALRHDESDEAAEQGRRNQFF